MTRDVVKEYLGKEKERFKEIVTNPFKQIATNFVATLTLPQAEKPKMLYPKDNRPLLQVVDEILKGE